MNLLKYIPQLEDFVEIPDSSLGKLYGVGKVVRAWHNTVQVDFDGHLGQYTISKHEFIKVN